MWTYNYSDELYHHGIKGQKWGVRRFQNKDGSLTNAGKSRYGNSKSKSGKDAKSFVQRVGKQSLSSVKDGMSEDSMLLLADVLSVSLAIGSIGLGLGYGKYLSHKMEKEDRKRKLNELEYLNDGKELKNFKDVPRLSERMPASESMKVTNPGYPLAEGRVMNCAFCTTALALREKGYDVVATKSKEGWYSDDLFKTTFNAKTVKMPKKTTPDDMFKELASYGEGAYGNLSVVWKMGGGHSIFWKNEGGKTRIYDGQNGKEYTKTKDSEKIFKIHIDPTHIQYNRLDNCEPTEYALAVVEKYKKE